MTEDVRTLAGECGAAKPGVGAPPDEVERLIAALLVAAHAGGGVVGFIDDAWIRVDGRAQSIRLFPHAGGVDVQLSGANEGALRGLEYRYDVPLGVPGGDDEVDDHETHLRACAESDVTPGVRSMLEAWLGDG